MTLDIREESSHIHKSPFNLKAISYWGHILYFGSFFLLNNPYYRIEPSLRFSIYGLMIFTGTSLIFLTEKPKFYPRIALISFTLVGYIIAISQLREVYDSITTDNLQLLQASLSGISLLLSFVISNKFDIGMSRKAILIFGTPHLIWIFLNYSDLYDQGHAGVYFLGNFGLDSYQVIAYTVGITILTYIYEILDKKSSIYRKIGLSILSLMGAIIIINGYARGETIALISSIIILIFGIRKFSVIIAILIWQMSNIVSILSQTGLAVFDRMRVFLEGDYGERDVLLSKSMDVIGSYDIIDLFSGKGLGYFQYYHGFPLGLYPHNTLIESLISGGVLLFIPLSYIFIVPLILSYLKKVHSREALYEISIIVMVVLVALKSGNLSTAWDMFMFLCFSIRILDNIASTKKATPS